MNAGDLIWGMFLGWLLLGLVWLACERGFRERRAKRRKRVRSRMSVVRPLDAARRRHHEVRPVRMAGER